MAITIETVRAVLAASKSSEVEFLDGIEATKDDCAADKMSTAAQECANNYRTAIDALLENNVDGAREAILDAMSLEGEHIHYTHARAALAALDEAVR